MILVSRRLVISNSSKFHVYRLCFGYGGSNTRCNSTSSPAVDYSLSSDVTVKPYNEIPGPLHLPYIGALFHYKFRKYFMYNDKVYLEQVGALAIQNSIWAIAARF